MKRVSYEDITLAGATLKIGKAVRPRQCFAETSQDVTQPVLYPRKQRVSYTCIQ
jgi:hypothetical protein